MTDVIVNVMVEVLGILSVVTKEIKQNRASKSIPETDQFSWLTVI